MMFSEEGHIDIRARNLLAEARNDPRTLVNNILLAGTPRAFDKYNDYCWFRRTLAERLHLHPCSMVIRGSARLGYSTAPVMNKAWQQFSSKSDIDVAIADVDYFNRFDSEIRSWESRQSAPPNNKDAQRDEYRVFNCIPDLYLPPNTCVWHCDVMDSFDSTDYCGMKRRISAFVFRDWWSLRNRWESDLQKLCLAVDKNWVGPPPE